MQLRKFNSKYFFVVIITAAIFCLLTTESAAQVTPRQEIIRPLTSADTVKSRINNDTTSRVIITANDTLPPGPDSTTINPLLNDSTSSQRVDTFSLKLSKDTLDAPVKYAAEMVVIMVPDKKIFLYENTKTEYKDIVLTAPKVELDQQTQVLTAVNSRDSLGQIIEDAHFVQGTDENKNEFTSDTIRYNFKTQKGLTSNTITQSGELFVHGETVKKMSDNVTYVRGGLFTTCNLDDPHFAFRTGKMKVVSNKVAVSGPTHPEFEGVPVPVYLPFGFFPLRQGRRSGLLPATFETNEQYGLGLSGLGYYKVISDYWDVKVYGNVYSYGGWSANVNPTYRKRYRYSGAFNLGVQNTKMNFKGDPDYYKNRTYTITWSHNTDSRARPGTQFNANVNASSTAYNRLVPNSPQLNYQNLMGSSISYSKSWEGRPYNLTMSANHSQNNELGLININLPDVGFSVSTIYPFRKYEGGNKWYDQLGIGYQGNFRNQVSFYDTAFTFRRLIDTLQWGAQHNIPITLSLPPILGGAVVVSPSVSYSQVWIAQKFRREWNDVERKVDTVITKGFFVDQRASFGISFNTAVYGTYQFRNSRIYAIRHVMRPSFSVNYQPDLSGKHFYRPKQLDTTGYTTTFSEFEGALFSGYGAGRYGGISFQLDNNLEMKWRSRKDTGENAIKKIRLIDGYGFNVSYNFFADSFALSPVNIYFRSNLFEKINITANASLNPYQSGSRGENINRYAWSDGRFTPGRITSGSISLSTSFQSKPKDAEKEAQKQREIENMRSDPALIADQQRLLDYMRQNPAEFVDFNIPWSFSLSYSLIFREQFKPDYSGFERTISSSAMFSGSFNLAPKWNFSVNGSFDFDTKQMQMFTMSISRDMHCWQMGINVSPIGYFRYFNFTINPKAGILQDLKINRTRSFFTPY